MKAMGSHRMDVRHVSAFPNDHCRERARMDEREWEWRGHCGNPLQGSRVRDGKGGGRAHGDRRELSRGRNRSSRFPRALREDQRWRVEHRLQVGGWVDVGRGVKIG